jgi:hypothetical protein
MASVLAKTNMRTIRVKPKNKIPESKPDEPEPESKPDEPESKPDEPELPVSYCDPDLFVKHKITRTITIPFYKITKDVVISQLLRTELAKSVEGLCSVEGYICPNSVSVCSHSGGTLSAGNILFDITSECLVCFPDEHTIIKCVAKTITQAGIRAGARYLQRGHVSPIEVFLSRDMNVQMRELFSRIEENDILTVEIIGRRFVLHDTHVTIIAMLLDAVTP